MKGCNGYHFADPGAKNGLGRRERPWCEELICMIQADTLQFYITQKGLNKVNAMIEPVCFTDQRKREIFSGKKTLG